MSERHQSGSFSQPMFNDWTLAFTQPATRQGHAYWEQCRGASLMPRVQDLPVRGMKAFIGNVALIDVRPRTDGPPDFAVKLAGENTKRVFGNVTGKSFGEFLTPEGERRWRFGAEAVCARKAPVRNYGTVAFEQKEWLDFETFLAPLGENDEVKVLFAVFVSWPRSDLLPSS